MAREIEIKLRVDRHEPTRERLSALGAKCLGRFRETNVIFDHIDGSLRKKGCGLRVRESVSLDDGTVACTFTYKGPRDPGVVKSREELEVSVDDFATLTSMVKAMGFVPILQYEKNRESWLLDDCRIELDEPPHIGFFVEIEGPSEGCIRDAQRKLALDQSELVQKSYVRLLADYCDAQGVSSRVLTHTSGPE